MSSVLVLYFSRTRWKSNQVVARCEVPHAAPRSVSSLVVPYFSRTKVESTMLWSDGRAVSLTFITFS